jgi:hypothetical protein
MKPGNLPNFSERFKPPQRDLVEADRNKAYDAETFFKQQMDMFSEFLTAVRKNIQPEFDANFVQQINFVSPEVLNLQYETRMFQFVIYNASSVTLNVGILEMLGLPYQISVASNRLFISPVYQFSNLHFSLEGIPGTQALPIVYAYNRILFTPGQFSLA